MKDKNYWLERWKQKRCYSVNCGDYEVNYRHCLGCRYDFCPEEESAEHQTYAEYAMAHSRLIVLKNNNEVTTEEIKRALGVAIALLEIHMNCFSMWENMGVVDNEL